MILSSRSLQCAPVPRGSAKKLNQLDVLISYLLSFKVKLANLTFQNAFFIVYKNFEKKIQKNVDIKTRKRMIRILLRGNSNVNPRRTASNECDYRFSFKRFSLTISYHAICVNTHINLFLHSYFGSKKTLNEWCSCK